MMRAVIDIGTNSVILLVAKMEKNSVIPVLQRFNVTRLGENLERTQEISSAAMSRTLAVLRQYNGVLKKYNISSIDLLGTEALRKATNSEHFGDLVQQEFGYKLTVLSTDQEAHLSYIGALTPELIQGAEVMVVDVGGGSTEISIGEGENIRFMQSVPTGVVKIGEQYAMKDTLSPREISAILNNLDQSFPDLPVAEQTVLTGTGGTISTLVAVKEKMPEYDPELINGYCLNYSEIEQLFGRLNGMTNKQRKEVPGLVPGREDVILYGTLIFMFIMQRYRFKKVIASDRGVRFGYLYQMEIEKSFMRN